MNPVARHWWALCLKMIALLCFIGAFIAFMRLQEEESELHRLRNQGVVSQAVVTSKEVDEITRRSRRGRTSSSQINVLMVRHNPKSTIPYADLGTKVKETDLPPPVPESKDAPIGVMWVNDEVFAKTQVGDLLTVVNTPYNKTSPELVSDVRDFSPRNFHLAIGVFLALTFLIWLPARRLGKIQTA